MIWSRWRPDRGGYDYFESADRYGLGDDLPTPRLSGGTEIGVPSTEIGRRAPSPMRRVGSGDTARGSLLPMSRAGLHGVGAILGLPSVWTALGAAALVAVGWWARKRWRG